jgi:hypothetical protein
MLLFNEVLGDVICKPRSHLENSVNSLGCGLIFLYLKEKFFSTNRILSNCSAKYSGYRENIRTLADNF